MRIVQIAAELAPIAKVGGLADAVYGLSRQLIAKKHSVEVIIPKYDLLNFDQQGIVDDIPVTLIEVPPFFNRNAIYGYEDDAFRFATFCRACVDYLLRMEHKPDIIHVHDWTTALIIPLLKESIDIPTVFTIHNLAYQGECSAVVFEKIGWKSRTINALKDPKGNYNLLKGGILFADYITTVSPNYANEILKTELGGILQPTLQKQRHKFSGVLNGIDYHFWNPETDSFLPAHYSSRQINGKARVKELLRQQLNLAHEPTPLVSVITRLVSQKGIELIKTAIAHILDLGGQFILVGSTFDKETRSQFEKLKQQLVDSRSVYFELTYNEMLSHHVYAASDLFLVPSLFEPCGLTPLIAMRYGTIPLVRQTGGLCDTVSEQKNGFTFGPPTSQAFNDALDRAFDCWHNQPILWKKLMNTGMNEDFSWNKPAAAYLEIYTQLSN